MKKSLQEVRQLIGDKAYHKLLSSESFFEVLTKTLLLVLALVIPILSFDYGVTWDERISIQFSRDMLRYFATWGSDVTCLDTSIPVYNHMIYYGNIFGLLSSLLNKIIPLDIIQTRHLLCSIFGLLTIVFIVKHTRLIKDYKLAFLTLLLLVFSPRFFGYIMNDFRDTTFMLGFVASTYYIQIIYRSLPSFSFKTGLKTAIFIFLASGVRIGGMILLVFLALILLIYTVKNRKELTDRFFSKAAGFFVMVSVVTYFLVVAIWPWAHESPFTRPLEAAMKFSDLQLMLNYQLFKGSLIPNRDVPIDFLFTWIGITTPLILLAGLLASLGLLRKNVPIKKSRIIVPLVAISIPLLAYFFQLRNLYDGWRHFLFLAPYLALFGAIGWYLSITWIRSKKVKYAFVILFLALLSLPASSMVKNHPLHTLYFNELIGGIKGAYGDFELDMDGNSLRKATEWLNDYASKNNINNIRLASNNGGLSISAFADPFLIDGNPVWLPMEQTFIKDWDYAILSTRTLSKYQIRKHQWPLKESIYNIEIDGIPVISVLKRQDRNLYYGHEAFQKGDYQSAITFFNAAKKYQPDLEDSYRLLGITYLQLSDYENAERNFNSALQRSPASISVLYYLGEIAYHQRDYERAKAYLTRSKEVRLDNYRADYMMANVYIREGKLEENDEVSGGEPDVSHM